MFFWKVYVFVGGKGSQFRSQFRLRLFAGGKSDANNRFLEEVGKFDSRRGKFAQPPGPQSSPEPLPNLAALAVVTSS